MQYSASYYWLSMDGDDEEPGPNEVALHSPSMMATRNHQEDMRNEETMNSVDKHIEMC